MSTENLYHQEAKDKIKELAMSIDYTMLISALDANPFHSVPMSTKKVDKEGNIWFLSGKESEHNKNIFDDKHTYLIYSDPSSMQFLKLYGEAFVVTDKLIIENLYGKGDDIWFDGPEDTSLTAIKFVPTEAYYWEPKSNSFVTLFKMGVGLLTGDQTEIAEEGKLKV